MSTPASTYPNFRFPADATWEQAAHELVRWYHAAAAGHACPAPDGWSWRASLNVGDPAFLHREWGAYNRNRGPNDDLTDNGAVVERTEDGRWRWVRYRGLLVEVSGIDDTAIGFNARTALERRAATWLDPRDAVADCERWLDQNAAGWRDGVKYPEPGFCGGGE